MDELTVKSRVQLNRTVTVLWHVQNKSHSKKQKKIMDFVAVSEFRKVALSLIQQQQTLLWSEVTHWLSWFVDLRWYQRQFSTSSNIVQDLVVFCSVPLLSLVICCCFFFFYHNRFKSFYMPGSMKVYQEKLKPSKPSLQF